MSKRFIFLQQQGERKKAKLDVTISDHNFPLSQNPEQESDHDNWGDDNDDEILLLASQACEQAYNNDISSLPDYSMCMQPQSTSTQIYDPGPSTSNNGFSFKKPSSSIPATISTNLKNKCSMISIPGMSDKVMTKVPETINIAKFFNDKVYKGQDSGHLYRQLLQMQEENAKLKSENGKLLEKCVTKEGEASILRTQLKTCQVAVDNARLEKIKAQEKVQMEWTDKLSMANIQLRDLRNQLDFKNLEIISIKEKCKKLESSKIRLTQVTVGNNDISSSHRNNNSVIQNDLFTHQRRVTTTNATQTTVQKQLFLKLNKTCIPERSELHDLLPLVLEPTAQHHNILDYNDKLQKHTDSQKCRVYSTFHRLPSTPSSGKEVETNKLMLASVHEDLTIIAAGRQSGDLVGSYSNVFKAIKSVLLEVQNELETVSRRWSTAFQKDMDERYIDATASCRHVNERELLAGSLYKEEQALLARRMVAIAARLLQNNKTKDLFTGIECSDTIENRNFKFLEVLQRICGLLDSTSCATLYSGLLLSTAKLIQDIHHDSIDELKMAITKSIISSRAMPFVACEVLNILKKMPEEFLRNFCPGSGTGNLKLDYDQGVLLFKKDSCYIQVLLKQIEVSLKCMERQNTQEAVAVTGNLINIYSNINVDYTEMNPDQRQSRCDCQLVLIQVIVYGLRICSVMLENNEITESKDRILAVCRSGIHVLYRCVVRDVEFGSQLGHNEGHLLHFCEIMRGFTHSELYSNMLSEISAPQPELAAFQHFSIAD
ncbi:uncharacterized protein LOC128678846 isoform X2 [Plodia interpunctella]|uniref:uncharacterized protein LOC128678846 isoform X2 n=1 Tax=Plodia interpunctella TaxID=58824 RepID=UPI002368DE29|nr:uncharacterized protein LOC128678846 isoform X2 [Plodia interpunctella]